MVKTVESVISFSGLDLSAFEDDAFAADFNKTFKAEMAAKAGVSTDDVKITAIASGSVKVTSKVNFRASDASAPEAFSSALQSSPGSLFSEDFLAAVGGEVAVDASDVKVTEALVFSPVLLISATLPSPTPQALTSSSSSGGGVTAIAGAGAGGVAALLIIVALFCYCKRRKTDRYSKHLQLETTSLLAVDISHPPSVPAPIEQTPPQLELVVVPKHVADAAQAAVPAVAPAVAPAADQAAPASAELPRSLGQIPPGTQPGN